MLLPAENIITITKARALWSLLVIYSSTEGFVSECPSPCECNSQYCRKNFPYKPEWQTYYYENTEYKLAKEFVLQKKGDLARDAMGKSEDAVREILKDIINTR